MLENFVNFVFRQTKMYVAMKEQNLAAEKEISIKKTQLSEKNEQVEAIKKAIKKIKKLASLVEKSEHTKEIKKICNDVLKGKQ